jgi:hypothetical protein
MGENGPWNRIRSPGREMPETPFDNVEAAHEYVGLLLDTVRQARAEVAHDLEQAQAEGAARQVEALQLVAFKLDRLEAHLGSSRHLLNDLRRLRTLLLGDESGSGDRTGGDDPDEPWGA